MCRARSWRSTAAVFYRVQCDQGHEVLAQFSGRMRRFRIKVVPGDRVTVGVSPVRSRPRHHHLPRSLKTHFEFPHNTTHPGRAAPDAEAPRGDPAGLTRTCMRPQRPQSIDRPQATTIPSPVPFDTLGLESGTARGRPPARLRATTTPIQSAVIPIALGGARRHRLRRHGHGQDRRLRAADSPPPAEGARSGARERG